jgi:type III restriction enzyme
LSVDPKATKYRNPLLLVQVPNGPQGKKYIEIIENICASYGITEESGRLGKYLSEGKSDEEELKRIASADSPIEVLIFKQGIALGWDCPRAKGLVAYRESKNDIFRVQTVGRIVRMPEHHHYDNDTLNHAFVFTNLSDSLFDFSNSGTGTGYLSDRTLVIRDGISVPTNMPTSNWSRSGFQGNVTAERLDAALKTPAAVAALASVASQVDQIQKDAVVEETVLTDVDIDMESVFGEVSKTSGKTSDVTVSDASLAPLFKEALADILPESYTNVSRSVATFLPRYREWAIKHSPSLKGAGDSVRIRQALLMFVFSADVREAWKTVLEICQDGEPINVTRVLSDWQNFSFPEALPASSDKGEAVAAVVGDIADTYLYVDNRGVAFLETTPSAPERSFMEKVLVGLKNEGRLVWWWKNGESGSPDTTPYFRIPHIRYRNGGNNRLYPDYIVCYLDSKGRERVAVLEVKDGGSGNLTAFSDDSRMKAETLGDWAANQTGGSYVAGLTYFDAMSKKWKFADTADRANDGLLEDALA